MSKISPVAIFMAASAIMTSCGGQPNIQAGESGDLGGTKEWTTDQGVNEDGNLDEDAQRANEKAKDENVCIPIGEGENCW